MKLGKYILNDKKQILPCNDLVQWGIFMSNNKIRVVKQELFVPIAEVSKRILLRRVSGNTRKILKQNGHLVLSNIAQVKKVRTLMKDQFCSINFMLTNLMKIW